MSKVVNFRLSEEQQVALRSHAKEHGVSITDVVVVALEDAGVFGARAGEPQSAAPQEQASGHPVSLTEPPVLSTPPVGVQESQVPVPQASPVLSTAPASKDKAKLGFCRNHHYAGIGVKCRLCGERGAS